MFEDKGKVIVVEKTRSTWTGPCTITKSKAGIRNDPKEYVTRRWFAVDEDELTPAQADNYLTDGRGNLRYERIIHVVISLRNDQRLLFAGNDDELSEVMRAATIEAMRVLAEGVETRDLVWVARTQPDYKNPCVKVLIRRDIGRGRSKVLKAFPRRLCSPCSEAFFRVFNEAASRTRANAPAQPSAYHPRDLCRHGKAAEPLPDIFALFGEVSSTADGN